MADPSLRSGDWQCPNPGCINHTGYPANYVYGSKVNCPKCGTGKSATRPGDWCCPNQACVNHQNTVYGSKTNCSRCGAEKPALNARGGAVPNASPHIVGSLDAGPNPGGVPTPRLGDWHCPNPTCKNYRDNLVFGSKDHCPICGTDKPAPPPGGAPAPAPAPAQPQYAPPAPGPARGPVDLRSFVGGCGGGKGGGGGGGGLGPGGVSPARPGDWHCSNPTCKNHTANFVFSSKTSCPICGTPKSEGMEVNQFEIGPGPQIYPGGKGGFAGGQIRPGGFGGGKGGFAGGKGQPGDWHCANPSCKNHTDNVVYASKVTCPICGSPKPGSGALVSSTCRPGDWQCPDPTCKNHVNGVYASKPFCTICGSPKPADSRGRSRSPRQS